MRILTRARAGWHGGRGTALVAGLALVLTTVGLPGGTAAASSKLWKIQKTANVTVPNGTLSGMSCPSAGVCLAVGNYISKSGVTVPLAESWNGTAWAKGAAPPKGALAAISCTGAESCEAVGATSTGLVAYAWNGTAWAAQAVPAPAGATQPALKGLSCISADFCEAVGTYVNSSGETVSFAAQWNGSSWSDQATPSPAGSTQSDLSGVSCTAANNCEAVGSYNDSSGNGWAAADGWNGTTWSVQTVPASAGIVATYLQGISCPSAGFCEAGGGGLRVPDYVTLAAQWNGTSWSSQVPPDPAGAISGRLNAVSCLSASFCEAVGYTSVTTAAAPLAEAWNGTSWSIQTVPAPSVSYDDVLYGVSCAAATACEAAGAYSGKKFARAVVLAEGWNGTAWRLQSPVQPIGATTNSLGAVSCVSAADCEAVGSYTSTPGDTVPLAEAWHGTSWKVQSTPKPKASTDPLGTLSGVSCVTASFCEAVGAANGSSAAFAEKWTGTAWQRQSAPGKGPLAAVSCVSASFCEAVGTRGTSSGTGPLAEVWTGTAWKTQTLPAPAGASLSAMTGVSCTSADSCEAVGTYNDDIAFAAVWNGSSWAPQTVPSPAGASGTVLNGVSCPAAGACEAVGLQESSSSSGPLAEVWNGTKWAAQATPLPTSADSGSLGAVSCTSAAACTAAGYDYVAASDTELTLAEVWNGKSWKVQSTPNPASGEDTFSGVSCGAAGACTAVGSGLDPGDLATATLSEAGG
jgi:hypothetical protein